MATTTPSEQRTHGATAPAAPSFNTAPKPAAAFVWGVWALMSLLALRFAWRYGSLVPYLEEWLYVPFALGETPISLSWLWEQYFEHRSPLHKLLIYLSFRIFGLDERPILLLDVGLFALLAAALIWAVSKVRGRASYADAFFPIVLLHFGHAETFLWAGTNVYVMTTFLSGMILVILFATGSRFTPRSAALAGVCLVLLPLIFGGGVLYAACLSCGLGAFGVGLVRSADPSDRRAGSILLGFAGVSLAIVALNFVGYEGGVRITIVPGEFRVTPAAVLKTTVKFLTTAFGFGARDPYYGWMKWVMVALLTIGGGCLSVEIFRRRLRGCQPLLGLALVWGSTLVVALAVGYGRVPWGARWLEVGRYAAAAAPTLLCLYLIWEACGPSGARPFGRAALCILVFAFLAPEWAAGMDEGLRHRQDQEAFLADVRAGMPVPRLIGRHSRDTYYRHDILEETLRRLRDRRHGDYARIAADPTFREIPLTAPPSAAIGAVWDGKRGHSTSDAPELIFDLPDAARIAGIRMRYSNVNPGGWVPIFAVELRTIDEDEGKHWKNFEHLFLKSDGLERVVTFWLDARVDRIRIRPDIRPCEFTLADVVLLVPEPPWEPVGADRASGGEGTGGSTAGGDASGQPSSAAARGVGHPNGRADRVLPGGAIRGPSKTRS